MNEQEYSKASLSEIEAQEIENIYNRILGKFKEFSGKADTKVLSKSIADLIDFIIEMLSSGGEFLLLYTSKIFDEDYIFAHSLNVCLISISIGLKLRSFDEEHLKELGFLALTHAGKDVGFPEELIKRVKHEKEMDEIIKLADVYDALTHPPAYRHAMTPIETLESVIKGDRFFDKRLVKILLKELSLYPKGSWVQLSTKEIGKVIKINKGLLLRPTVEVFIDWEGRHLEERKIVDLSKNNLIYILRPLTEEEIKNIRLS